jgi:HlyD family secretion protein
MRQRRGGRYWLAALLAAAALGGVFAWSTMRKAQASADLPTAKARQGEFLVVVRCRGELAAARSMEIVAPVQVSDLQIVWLAPPNSIVTEGQTVIRFDPSAAQQAIREHTAALRQAQANLDQDVAQARITAQGDKLDLAKAQYDLEKARLEASQQAIVSEIQGAESNIEARMAEEKLRVEQATVELHEKSGEAKIASLTRLRDQERSELNIANRQVSLMELKSPNNGIIVYSTNTSQGWVNAQPYKVGDHAFPGAVLAEVPDLASMRVEAKLEEADRGQVSAGEGAIIRIDALPEKTWKGKLAEISPLTEQSFEWPPTRSFKAYIALDNPAGQLRPGMNAGADIVISRIPNAVSIPVQGLFTDQGRPVVYLRKAHGYAKQAVTVAARNPDEVALKGLAAGTTIALVQPPQEGSK